MKLKLIFCVWIIILLKNSAADKDVLLKLQNFECNKSCEQTEGTQNYCDIIFGIEVIVNKREGLGVCKPTGSKDVNGRYCDHCQYTGFVNYTNWKRIEFSNQTYPSNNIMVIFKDNPSQIESVYVYVYKTRSKWITDKIAHPLSIESCDVYNKSSRIWGSHSFNFYSCNLSFHMNYTCSEFYYGEDCDVYCKQHDDNYGHYSCDINGTKICKQGYSGENCTVYDFCSSSPCDNNSTCKSTVSDYSCSCSNGFSGKNCSIDIDECASNPCGHGACKDLVSSFMCECDLGFTGFLCDKDIDYCINGTCHHGECIDGQKNYTCKCEDGFTGAHCNASVDDCMENMCINGTCVDGYKNYTCLCNPDYTGIYCDTRIDYCFNNSCAHGKCIEELYKTSEKPEFRYFCNCDLNFTGQFCDTFIHISTEFVESKSTTEFVESKSTTEFVESKSTITKSYSSEVTSSKTLKPSKSTELSSSTKVSAAETSTSDEGSNKATSINTTRKNKLSNQDESKDILNKKEVKYSLIAAAAIMVVLVLIITVVCYKRRKGRQPSMSSVTNTDGKLLWTNNGLNNTEDLHHKEDLRHSNGAERVYAPKPGDRGSSTSIVSNTSIIKESQNDHADEMSHL